MTDDELIERVARAAFEAHHRCGPTEEAYAEPNWGRGGFKTEIIVWEAVARAAIAATGVEHLQSVVEALKEAKMLCGQVPVDLASAHAEICKLQNLDPKGRTWPDWTPQANTLRWIESKVLPAIDAAIKTVEKK